MTKRFLILGLCALAAIAAFMVLGAKGNWDFVLMFRGKKLIALVCVAIAISVATIVFQTLTGNRILTPEIMGFDVLFRLLQTGLVFVFGGMGYALIGAELKFLMEFCLLSTAALLLFGTLLGHGVNDLFRMLLAGVIFGILFRSLISLLARLIDPNEFAALQSAYYASFNRVDTTLLMVAVPMILVSCLYAWKKRHVLDVMALGREQAIGLGLNFRRELFSGLIVVTALVATSTALVGPVTFFGLLVSAVAYEVIKSHNHGPVLVAAALIAITVLVGGQAVFERLLGMGATLSIIVEFVGGLVFLYLVLRKVRT